MNGQETTEWMESALCAQVGASWFFPEGQGTHAAEAKMICRECVTRRECLELAMTTESTRFGDTTYSRQAGVWGGLSSMERRRLGRSGWKPGDPLPEVRHAARQECPHCGGKFARLAPHIHDQHPSAA